jgi:sRNA-binding regulator protein Hfq
MLHISLVGLLFKLFKLSFHNGTELEIYKHTINYFRYKQSVPKTFRQTSLKGI